MIDRTDRLPLRARKLLAHFFPGFNLRRIRIRQGIPWYVIGRPVGYADRNRIFLDPGSYSVDSIEGLSLLAHEIVHCRQYNSYGTWRFRRLYLASYFKNRLRGMSARDAYLNIPFEVEAREMEYRVYSICQKIRL